MNYLYLNNAPQQPMTHSFVFSKRNEKIDWRRIAAVDVDRIARDLDFKVLQDNLEQIALCNIDMEVDTRSMDPNFIKLYKMSQLTIEYLLLCQDQITNQLVDYEQIKGKSTHDQDEFQRELQKLKNELNITKKEAKKRKKTIETQEKMLMARHQNHYTCPICTRSYLTFDYLHGHIHRRHPEHDPDRKREHDVDIEKEIQRVKEELRSKDTELQIIKVQKAVDEEKIRERDENIHKLKEDMQLVANKMTILEGKYYTLQTSNQNPTPTTHAPEDGVKELLKENKALCTENEQLKQKLHQTENTFRKEKKRLERQNQTLQQEINNLKENILTLKNASGDSNRLSDDLNQYRNRYNEEKNRRKKLEDQLDVANKELAHLRNQPPPPSRNDRKSPVPQPRTSVSPPPPMPNPTRPITRPVQPTDIFLPQFCPSLIQKVNQNPQYLNNFRKNAKKLLNDEFEQLENFNIKESDTRLSDKDYQAKMKTVEQTRKNIQDDLKNFEPIRRELIQIVDKLVNERLHTQSASGSSNRLSGGKLVKFEDESRQNHPNPSSTIQSKSKFVSNNSSGNFHSDDEDDDDDDNNNYSQTTRFVHTTEMQPSPRKNAPSTGVNALVDAAMKPKSINNTKTIQTLVRPKSALTHEQSDSDDENLTTSDVPAKPRLPNQKLNEVNPKGQKPIISALVQSSKPTQKPLVHQDDNDSDSSLTSVHDANPQRKTSVSTFPQNSLRPLTNTGMNQNLSSGEMSQYTYDSLLKSPAAKGFDIRRPATADSAKTSIIDSDDEFDRED